ncbi:MAG: hypothetical protein DHS20C15_01150 [Planctomycetota bacterium]|nr:MAG: hypothetical protein DHS20C15_01150 [Planctomycetota bacterium]
MYIALALLSSLVLPTIRALPQDTGELTRSGISDKDLGKLADDVSEFFLAIDADDRATKLELEESLLSAFAKSGKRAKIDRDPMAYTGDWDYVLELSKPVDRSLKSDIGKGFFKHVFEDQYGTPPVSTALSIPASYGKEKDSRPPVIVVLKETLGLEGNELDSAVIEKATLLYGDLLETHIVLIPMGTVAGEGRRAETVETKDSWLAPDPKQVFFTGLRVLLEQLRFDRSRIVLDGWGSAGAEAIQFASFAPSWFAGVVSRGGELPGEDAPLSNLASMGVLLLQGDGSSDPGDAFEGLDVEIVPDAGSWEAPTDEASAKFVEWAAAQQRDLAPSSIEFLAADLAWGADNWCNIKVLNRRVTASPSDKDFPRISATIDAASNTIDIETVNILELKVFLNDDLVDLDKALTVKVNGEEKFSGVLKRSLSFLLENRYYMESAEYGAYTASVLIEDIDANLP